MVRSLVLMTLVACADLPKDPHGTLEPVRGGVLDVGLLEDPPWVVVDGEEVSGLDVELVRELAAQLDAEVRFSRRPDALEALAAYELDLVVGRLDDKDPWRHELGFTRPYFDGAICVGRHCPKKNKRVWAVPMGENAMLVEVERFLLGRQQELEERLRG